MHGQQNKKHLRSWMIQLPFSERIEIVLSITFQVGSLWILRGHGDLVPEKESTMEYKSTQCSTRVHNAVQEYTRLRILEVMIPNLDPQTGYTDFSLFIPVTPGEYRQGPSNQTKTRCLRILFNPLKPELNPICYLLALLGAHHFLRVSRIRVKLLTFRLLMSYIYIYGAPILDVSRSHTTTQHSR